MTLPNEAEGISELISLAFASTGTDGSIPGQQNNDQPTIEALLKERMFESAGWQGAHLIGYTGLPSSIPLVLGILAKLAEQITGLPVTTWITMWTTNPTIGGLVDIVEDALAKIFTVNVNLQSIWGDLDFLDLDFDPQDAWALIGNLIPDWLEDLIFGNEGTEFPLTFPHEFAPEASPVVDFFYWVRKFTGLDDFEDLASLSLIDLIVNFIETLLKPQELLAWLIDGILPDDQAPNVVFDIIDAIVQGFAGIPVVGDVVQGVWDTIQQLLGIGNDAQATGTDNSAEIAAIKAALAANAAGGVSFVDDFDRILDTDLGAGYTQFYSGIGAGTEGTDGTGYCHWSAAGGAQRVVFNRSNTPLTTNTQYAAFVLRNPPRNRLSLQPVVRQLTLRSNAAGTNRVTFNIHPTGANLHIIVGGSVVHEVNWSPPSGTVFRDGDLFEFFAGSTADDYQFAVRLNSRTVLNYLDSGHLSQVGASNLYPGFGGTAGIFVLIILPIQDTPPDVAAFAAADRLG